MGRDAKKTELVPGRLELMPAGRKQLKQDVAGFERVREVILRVIQPA
jgi:hypothetical protein